MNDQEAVAHMTEYIRELEQTALRNKLISGTQSKSSIVNSILGELEKADRNLSHAEIPLLCFPEQPLDIDFIRVAFVKLHRVISAVVLIKPDLGTRRLLRGKP